MLSKSGTHAVHAMIALAALPEGSFGGSSAIAHQVGAPPNYLGKILQTLAKEGLVVSQKGMGGGWALGRSAAKITLLDIVEPLEDMSRWRGCFLSRSDCSDQNPCHVHDAWAPVRDAFLGFLVGTTLDQLMRDGGMGRLQSILAKP